MINKNIFIIQGGQTEYGKTFELANETQIQLSKFHDEIFKDIKFKINTKMILIDKNIFDKILVRNSIWIILVSTFQDGEPSYFAKNIQDLCMSHDFEKINLKSFNISKAIQGLGDRKQPKFNTCAQTINVRLNCNNLIDMICGDESGNTGYYESYDLFIENILQQFRDKYQTLFKSKSIQIEEIYNNFISKNQNYQNYFLNENLQPNYNENFNFQEISLKSRELESVESNIFINKFSTLSNSNMNIYPGSILRLQHRNSDELLQKVRNHFNIESSSQLQNQIENLDFFQKPSRYNLIQLMNYVNDDIDSEQSQINKLKDFIKNNNFGRSEQYRYFIEYNKSFIDLIIDFNINDRSCLYLLKPIVPRDQSIYNQINDEIYILFNLQEQNINNNVYKGYCTNQLSSCNLNLNFKCKILSSDIFDKIMNKNNQFNRNESTNQILISNGTGIAPLHQILEQLNYNNSVLITGHRNKNCAINHDYYKFKEQENKFKYFPIYSREGPKQYVQNFIKSQEFRKFIESKINNAVFFICGSSSMTIDVMNCIDQLGKSILDSENYSLELLRQGKIAIESW